MEKLELGKLSQDELRELAGRIALQLEGSTESPDNELLHSAISSYLAGIGVSAPPVVAVRKGRDAKALREGASAVSSFVAEHVTKRRVETIATYRVLVRMLARHLRNNGIPVSYRTLVRSAANVVAIADCAYPGYREAGLLGRILRTVA